MAILTNIKNFASNFINVITDNTSKTQKTQNNSSNLSSASKASDEDDYIMLEVNSETNFECENTSGVETSKEEFSSYEYGLILEMEAKIEEFELELEGKKKAQGVLGFVKNGVAGIFGGGFKKDEEQLNELKSLMETLKAGDIENIEKVYEQITGIELTSENTQNIQEAADYVKSLDNDTKTLIKDSLLEQVESMQTYLDETKSNNGIIGGIWDTTKNILGVGASSNKAQSKIDNLRAQIESSSNDDLAALYKNLTGKDLTEDELNSYIQGETSLYATDAANAVLSYEEGQAAAVDVMADVASAAASFGCYSLALGGAVAAPFTGGASLGLTAAAVGLASAGGAAAKVAVKGFDAATGGYEYSAQDALKDAGSGAINGPLACATAGIGYGLGKIGAKLGVKAAQAMVTQAESRLVVGFGKTVSTEAASVVFNEGVSRGIIGIGEDALSSMAENSASSALSTTLESASQNTMRYAFSEINNASLRIIATDTFGTLGKQSAINGAEQLILQQASQFATSATAGALIEASTTSTMSNLAQKLTFKGIQGSVNGSVMAALSSGGNYLIYTDADDINVGDMLSVMGTSALAGGIIGGGIGVGSALLGEAINTVSSKFNNKSVLDGDYSFILDDSDYSIISDATDDVSLSGTAVGLKSANINGEIIPSVANSELANIETNRFSQAAQTQLTNSSFSFLAGKTSEELANLAANSVADSNQNKFYSASLTAANSVSETDENSGLIKRAVSKIKDKVKTAVINTKTGQRIYQDYQTAVANSLNVPDTTSVDMQVLKEIQEFISGIQDIVSSEEALNSSVDVIKNYVVSLEEISEDINYDTITISENIAEALSEKSETVRNLLIRAQNGEDVSEAIVELAQQGIDITEIFEAKTLETMDLLIERLEHLTLLSEEYGQSVIDMLDAVQGHSSEITTLTNDAKAALQNIPDTGAFKQLGNMPERISSLLSELREEATELSEKQAAIEIKILEGDIEEGLQDLNDYYAEMESFQERLEQAQTQAAETAEKAGLTETYAELTNRAAQKISAEGFSELSRTQQAQALIEEANIALPKFIQTMSSDETLPDSVRSFFKEFTSNCTTTRTLEEAQSLTDQLYGEGKYTVQKSFGAGSIGETYLVTDSDDNEFVMKMLKKGVTEEKFQADRKMLTQYIEEFTTDEADKEYKLKLINGLFDSWERELDYAAEALGAEEMANGAQRFKVAQTLEIGTLDGSNISLIMEKADGIGLDELISLLEFKNEHPDDYLTLSISNEEGKELNPWIKKSALIEQNSWILDTESYMEKLPVAYQKAQNEQSMFLSSSGSKTVHADPHGGNVFVSFDTETQTPVITYIDTGNVITRTNSEILSDICLSLNMLIGNSEGIATSLLDGAILPEGASRSEMISQVAQLLDSRLYQAGVNLKNVNYTQSTMMNILKELNIIPDAGNSNLLKANLQRIKTSREIFAVTETEANKAIDIKDMLTGIAQSFKEDPRATLTAIKPIIKWAKNNKDQALITFFQMMLKSNGLETSTD